jgi:cobalamin biosynthesis Mg chelatase CobN
MGLIRKSLAVGSLGVVHGSSKKQRVAKATMKSSAAAAQAAAANAATSAAATRLVEAQAEEEREFRYATDPVYKKFIDDKRATEEAARVARAAQVAEAARLKRERNQERWQASGRAIKILVVAIAMLIVGVVVWLPQLLIAKIRHEPANLWMQEQLRLSSGNS